MFGDVHTSTLRLILVAEACNSVEISFFRCPRASRTYFESVVGLEGRARSRAFRFQVSNPLLEAELTRLNDRSSTISQSTRASCKASSSHNACETCSPAPAVFAAAHGSAGRTLFMRSGTNPVSGSSRCRLRRWSLIWAVLLTVFASPGFRARWQALQSQSFDRLPSSSIYTKSALYFHIFEISRPPRS